MPNDRDEFPYQDDELSPGDDSSEDETQSDEVDAQSDEPPDWLYETVGLGDESDHEAESPGDEDAAEEDPQSSALGGVVFPDWLSDGLSQDDEDSDDILETLVGPSAAYEGVEEGAQVEVDVGSTSTSDAATDALSDL